MIWGGDAGDLGLVAYNFNSQVIFLVFQRLERVLAIRSCFLNNMYHKWSMPDRRSKPYSNSGSKQTNSIKTSHPLLNTCTKSVLENTATRLISKTLVHVKQTPPQTNCSHNLNSARSPCFCLPNLSRNIKAFTGLYQKPKCQRNTTVVWKCLRISSTPTTRGRKM